MNIIRSGQVERTAGGRFLDALNIGDFFGEEDAFLNLPGLYYLRAFKETTTVQIYGDLLKNVPIIRWKILESYQHNVASVVHGGEADGFVWSDSVAINVAEFDGHHRRLLEIANTIGHHLENMAERDSLVSALGALVKYTRYHFVAEEKLMELYSYPELVLHTMKHSELTAGI